MPELVKIAGVQMDVDFADNAANLARIEAHLRRTAAEGAVLTVFPECALTGYCFDSLEEARPHAETVPGPATEAIGRLCRELGVYTIFGMLELATDRIFNAAVLVGPEGVIGNYRKIHLPYLGVDRFTSPGDRQAAVWQCGPLRVGINICYDGVGPEPSRSMSLDGADLLALPTNWPPGAESTANHIINATGNFSMLRLVGSAQQDTTLVVRTPTGAFLCDDDGGGNFNPLVQGAFPPGSYQVWVGSYATGQAIPYRLAVTERPQLDATGF